VLRNLIATLTLLTCAGVGGILSSASGNLYEQNLAKHSRGMSSSLTFRKHEIMSDDHRTSAAAWRDGPKNWRLGADDAHSYLVEPPLQRRMVWPIAERALCHWNAQYATCHLAQEPGATEDAVEARDPSPLMLRVDILQIFHPPVPNFGIQATRFQNHL